MFDVLDEIVKFLTLERFKVCFTIKMNFLKYAFFKAVGFFFGSYFHEIKSTCK